MKSAAGFIDLFYFSSRISFKHSGSDSERFYKTIFYSFVIINATPIC